jgi:hypothetical protein
MPEPIREAIRAARGEGTGTIDDAEYRNRLQEKFGDRWTVTALVKAKPDGTGTPAGPNGTLGDVVDHGPGTKGTGCGVGSGTSNSRRARRSAKKTVVLPGPGQAGREVRRPVDVPKYRFTSKDDFEQPWHLALWSRSDTDGPTVYLNADSPFLLEVVKYHQDRYPDVLAEEVQEVVKGVFGEVAVAKIAHSQKIAAMLPEEQLDREYRSEAALTTALMGLLAEESLIATRLGRLGRSKAA